MNFLLNFVKCLGLFDIGIGLVTLNWVWFISGCTLLLGAQMAKRYRRRKLQQRSDLPP
jgi:threonine/homoserine/homoserine lactone efflux protein